MSEVPLYREPPPLEKQRSHSVGRILGHSPGNGMGKVIMAKPLASIQ
jgi:hypothetical protein